MSVAPSKAPSGPSPFSVGDPGVIADRLITMPRRVFGWSSA